MTYRKVLTFSLTLVVSVLLTGIVVSHRQSRSLRMGNELIESSWAGDVEKMRTLIEAGIDVNFNQTAHPSCIPLTCAAKQGHVEAVLLLLNSKADVNATDDSHMTALQWAQEKGHADVAGLLRRAGARE